MINTKFEAYKLERELKRSGISYEFKRFSTNKFGEPICNNPETIPALITTICGLYHEQNSNVQITTGDTTQVRTKKLPMILCLYDNATLLSPGDIVKINEKTLKVTGVVNIQEWGIIGDISLEVFDDGAHD